MIKQVRNLLFYTLLFVSWYAHATVIPPNTRLSMGQTVTSENGKYILVMQADGNLVLYRNDGAVRFATYRFGNNFAAMQGDGNFVVYNSNIPPLWLWHTVTWGNPGAFLNVQNDGNLVVYSSSIVPLWNIGVDPSPISTPSTPSASNPSYPGDVVGRDLNYPGLGWLGHLGLWDGANVFEVVNASPNAIRITTLTDFKNTSTYWGAASANIPDYTIYNFCSSLDCNYYSWTYAPPVSSRLAIAARAYQAMLIGADYTYTAQYTSALPSWS